MGFRTQAKMRSRSSDGYTGLHAGCNRKNPLTMRVCGLFFGKVTRYTIFIHTYIEKYLYNISPRV